jgi:hypothetical protein
MYWPGNDCLIGRDYNLAKSEITIQSREYPSLGYDPGDTGFELCSEQLDAEKGVVITGFLEALSKDARLVSPSAGIFMEESPGFGTTIWLHGYGLTEIGYGAVDKNCTFTVEESIGYGCAAPAGLVPGKKHGFRLLIRQNMYEFYLDDCHIDLFNTSHFPDKPALYPKKIGFSVRNGVCRITNLKINAMEI